MSEPSDRVRLRRLPDRGKYDLDDALRLMDEVGVATVAYARDDDVRQTPTFVWRHGDALFWHGSAASEAIRDQATGVACCVSAYVVDGLVLARSGMHSSVNYRSAICYGTASKIGRNDDKIAALEVFMERIAPGRWRELRPPTVPELRAVTVMRMTVEECSVKVNADFPADPEEDLTWPVWVGVVPVRMTIGTPVDAPDLLPGTAQPEYLRHIRLGGSTPG